MAGYVTTNRWSPKSPKLPFTYTSFGSTTSGADFLGLFMPAVAGQQTTTSWRTKSGGVDDELKNLDSATNELQAIQAIARDTKFYSNPWDTGHTFNTLEFYPEFSIPAFHYVGRFNGRSCTIPLIQNPTFLPNAPYQSAPSFSDLGYYGATAIRNTIPTNPIANLATALGEIHKDGLPHLPGFAGLAVGGLSAIKNIAENYLNYQFGWKPTVADTADAMTGVDRSKSVIDQFLRDNGKSIRRSFAFPEVVNTTLVAPHSGAIFDPGQVFQGEYISSGQVTETIQTKQRIWFKGAYTYNLPINKDFLSRIDLAAAKAQRVLGLEITPEVLWNLAPWSWFGGWLSDIGTLVHNAQQLSQDGLVLKYGYLMVQSESIHTVTTQGVSLQNAGSLGNFTNVYRVIRKERYKATPYGFGLNPNSFTGSQWSILGAIGLSRSPGSLRN